MLGDVGVELAVAATDVPWHAYRWWIYAALALVVMATVLVETRRGGNPRGSASVRQRAEGQGVIEDSPITVRGVDGRVEQRAEGRGVISGSGIDVE